MAAKKASKTGKKATAATGAKRPGGVDLSTDVIRFIPTGVDTPHAYVIDAKGNTIHSKVGSDRFLEAVRTLVGSNVATRCADHADTLEAQRPGFGWALAARILRGEEPATDDVAVSA